MPTTFGPDVLDGVEMVLATRPEHAAELEARGWTVRSGAGAPEGFDAADLRAAILGRDIAGLRETFGEEDLHRDAAARRLTGRPARPRAGVVEARRSW
jgi:hypothetical protein